MKTSETPRHASISGIWFLELLHLNFLSCKIDRSSSLGLSPGLSARKQRDSAMETFSSEEQFIFVPFIAAVLESGLYVLHSGIVSVTA